MGQREAAAEAGAQIRAVDPKTTALLVLDLMRDNCGARPRCVPIVPIVKKLIDEERAHNMMIVYNLTGSARNPRTWSTPASCPKPGDFMIKNGRGGDKFIRSNLDAGLKEKGVKTVIITGTSAQGAVATTSNGATGRGYKVVVPVDGTASEDAFRELYGIFQLAERRPRSPHEECDGDPKRPDQVRGVRAGSVGRSRATSRQLSSRHCGAGIRMVSPSASMPRMS